MNASPHLHNRYGFTMVELLLAILIMTVGVLATLSLISTALNANTISNKLTTKTALAQQVMEDILSRKVNDLDTSDPITHTTAVTTYDLNGSSTAGTDISIASGGVYHATYATVIDTPLAGTTRIVVTVSKVPDDGNPSTLTSYRRAN